MTHRQNGEPPEPPIENQPVTLPELLVYAIFTVVVLFSGSLLLGPDTSAPPVASVSASGGVR